ncbi:hypothetical protein SKAU_G00110200 [Synaphobranchus kaupii]|uniref:CTCK domain-containing protein n=1 Tax=Synaphobranchus kaupii TaxID=118154 RepID=A0A9Q1G0J1_SYNKA|nr:hypothetical protein SKAU_G00110200 [Synaphobranchus kaupii]
MRIYKDNTRRDDLWTVERSWKRDVSQGLRLNSPFRSALCFCTGAAMWKWTVIGWMLLKLCEAAPPQHINRLALFPDKSAWCEAKNITQIIGHTGCQPHSIQNRACLGQCFSYSVPNTFPQLTESLVHCDSCMPVQMQWEVVTLECPGNKEMPRVDKLVERILQCSCQSCNKEFNAESRSALRQRGGDLEVKLEGRTRGLGLARG